MSDTDVTRAEVCAVACADVWRDAGEVIVSPFGIVPSLGARLARLTFAPDIVLTDAVAEAPGGAHFTSCPPDYERDEGFQKRYASAAADPEAWAAFDARYLGVDDAGYRAAVDEDAADVDAGGGGA